MIIATLRKPRPTSSELTSQTRHHTCENDAVSAPIPPWEPLSEPAPDAYRPEQHAAHNLVYGTCIWYPDPWKPAFHEQS